MKCALLCVSIFLCIKSYEQKPVIDTNSIKNWISVYGPKINAGGDYVLYFLNDGARKNILVIQSIKDHSKKEFENVSNAVFSDDGKKIIFQKKDTLCIARTDGEIITHIPAVAGFQVVPQTMNEIIFQMKGMPSYVLFNMYSKEEQRFDSVVNYQPDKRGKYIIVQTEYGNGGIHHYLQLVRLDSDRSDTIWTSSVSNEKAGNFAFSEDGTKMAFLVERKENNSVSREVWLYNGVGYAQKKITLQTPGIENAGGITSKLPVVSNDGNKIFFWTQKQPHESVLEKKGPEIWKTADAILPSKNNHIMYGMPVFSIIQADAYLAVYNERSQTVTKLSRDHEKVSFPDQKNNLDFLLVRYCEGDDRESNWNRAAQSNFYLVNTSNGSRQLLMDHVANYNFFPEMSPTGRWIVYYDSLQKNFFTREVSTGIVRNITKKIPTSWVYRENDEPLFKIVRSITWLDKDEKTFIYDNDDLWLIDPLAKEAPLSITRGYGKRHHIRFRVVSPVAKNLNSVSLKNGFEIVLAAFSTDTKQSGFFSQKFPLSHDPQVLSMEPCSYGYSLFALPAKAAHAEVYIFQRTTMTEPSNIYVSTNLKKFVQLTNIQPQKPYNWLTAELVNWKTFDGTNSQGILYKPENFDSTKRYPVIFTFYERLSDKLYEFQAPGLTDADINIPWFVSRGYLIFIPDIYYKIGAPGESAYNCVVSAAEYLSTKSWVDKKRMGMYGHSFGGYEVNYIVTRTNLFAAAMDAAGPSDFISGYGLLSHGDLSRTVFYESTQSRIGASLWARPDLYFKNSPVLRADKVNTPLLIMHNKNDIQVPWTEGLEWFNALRRNGKKAWWLQYENGGHEVGREDAWDYTLRITEFFDHYLKAISMPDWMKR